MSESSSEPALAPGAVMAPPGWPARPGQEAFHGLAGDFIRAIEKETEADPVALLVQFLAAFGSVVGREAFFVVEGVRHHPNLFVTLVGRSSRARKGSSWGIVREIYLQAAGDWSRKCIQSGLSSGEGVIWAVRDASSPPMDHPGGSKKREPEDPGVADKRLLVYQSEFASILRLLRRDGNTLSPMLREAWDSGDLQSLVKTRPVRATGAHISIVSHITAEELLRHLDQTEMANGFGNRFMWVCVIRARLLPDGGHLDPDVLGSLEERLRQAICFAKFAGEMRRDLDAAHLWREDYPRLTLEVPGLLGSMTSRSEAQVLRLSMIYALLDSSAKIRVEHLRAAIALWEFCEASCRYIFGKSLGDPVADKLTSALSEAGPHGLTKTQIRGLFSNHKEDAIPRALEALERRGLVELVKEPSEGGRPVDRWFWKGGEKDAKQAN